MATDILVALDALAFERHHRAEAASASAGERERQRRESSRRERRCCSRGADGPAHRGRARVPEEDARRRCRARRRLSRSRNVARRKCGRPCASAAGVGREDHPDQDGTGKRQRLAAVAASALEAVVSKRARGLPEFFVGGNLQVSDRLINLEYHSRGSPPAQVPPDARGRMTKPRDDTRRPPPAPAPRTPPGTRFERPPGARGRPRKYCPEMRKILLGNPASRENSDADLQPRAGTPQKRTEFDGFPPLHLRGRAVLARNFIPFEGPFSPPRRKILPKM